MSASIVADMTVRGAATGHLNVGGSFKIQQANIRVPEKLPPRVAVLEVRRPGVPPPPPPALPPDIGLDLTIDAPDHIIVKGRGIDVELGGKVQLGGTAAQRSPQGEIRLIKGNYAIAGITMVFTEGNIAFNGTNALDPTLHFVTTQTSGTTSVSLTVGGTASAPKISLSSTPDLPQDEILARLLFNQSAVNLNTFQLAQIAAALAQISGVGGGIDPLSAIRNDLGLDRLSVEGGGSTGAAPSLQAGRYVAPGVMIGAQQGLGGAQTQATVQVDITKGLKLQGAVGTGLPNATGSTSSSAGGSIGLTYQFEY
jgi:translocation and assembly module TamB